MVEREITNFDIDILGEIGNIGSGNAATALSQILDMPVNLEVPMVQICRLVDVPGILGGPEEPRTAIFFGVTQALNGYILFLLQDDDVKKICNIVCTECEIEETSVISEISNIISGAYVGAIAQMINETVDITPPEVGHDMLGAMLDGVVSTLCEVADKTVVIGTKLIIGEETIPSFYVLLLEQQSLSKLLDYFNGFRS